MCGILLLVDMPTNAFAVNVKNNIKSHGVLEYTDPQTGDSVYLDSSDLLYLAEQIEVLPTAYYEKGKLDSTPGRPNTDIEMTASGYNYYTCRAPKDIVGAYVTCDNNGRFDEGVWVSTSDPQSVCYIITSYTDDDKFYVFYISRVKAGSTITLHNARPGTFMYHS